jgi:hypothetical protein
LELRAGLLDMGGVLVDQVADGERGPGVVVDPGIEDENGVVGERLVGLSGDLEVEGEPLL